MEMSAVASYEEGRVKPVLQVVPQRLATAAELQAREANRWMAWFGLPMLGACLFVAAVFATGAMWLIGGAIAFLIADICVLVWLCLSTCTNALGATPAAQH
jgi:uncharacterized membrane protein